MYGDVSVDNRNETRDARDPRDPRDVRGISLFPHFNHGNVGSRFFLRTAFAFLLSSGIFSVFAALVCIQKNNVSEAYVQVLSVIINWVAAYHYFEIVKARERGTGADVELKIDALRYGDWTITMPFLTLKLYGIINRDASTYDSIFSDPEIAAVTSVIMVVLGAFVRLGLDELSGWRRMSNISKIAGVSALTLSCVCLLLLLIDLGRAAGTHPDSQILFSLIFVWLGYPLVTFLASMWRHSDDVDTPYDLRLSIVKDASFSCLDIYAKGVFALYSGSVVFGTSFFSTR